MKEVPSFDSTHYMTNLNIGSLLTNIPLVEAINICYDNLFHNKTKASSLTKEPFIEILKKKRKNICWNWLLKTIFSLPKILQTNMWYSYGLPIGSNLCRCVFVTF